MIILLPFLLLTLSLSGQTTDKPVRSVTDPGVVTTRQTITPAGVPAIFEGRVYGVDFGADSSELWVLNASALYRLDWRQNKVLARIPLGGAPGLQALRYESGRALYTVASRDRRQVVLKSAGTDGQASPIGPEMGTQLAGAIAATPSVAAVPLTFNNKLAIVDLRAGTHRLIGTDIAPFGVVLNRDASVAWVTNWGGRVPGAKDRSAPTGYAPDADRVVVDERGVASSGTVFRVDIASGTTTHKLSVDPHPTAIVWDEAHDRIYVANSNKDLLTVIDTKGNRVLRSISVQPFAQKVYGIAPTALALSPDGSRLYVACGGINAIAIVTTATGKIDGLIPTAWYPNSLALSRDSKRLAVGTLLGAGSGWRESPNKRFVHSNRGSIGVIELPDAAQLASYTTAVMENNHMTTAAAAKPDMAKAPVAIPQRAGEPSLIEHVVYIVKENRTYDQVFGDLGKGNGDPALTMFGEDVTPNHHRLAEQYVLLDNFYATGGNSADGHQWVTQANQNTYAMWPGYAGRSYPYDGSDPLAHSDSGFLWTAALSRGKTVRIYGEYAGAVRTRGGADRHQLYERWQKGDDFRNDWKTVAPIASMNPILATHYPAYSTAIPDVVRAKLFSDDVKQWTKDGKMPNLILLQLPSNHTNGTSPGSNTAKAMVADNDLALGQVVEALSHSPFWKKMAIFVVEDDAQNGVDHVDGHRTVALAISPYTRRGHIDSTFYSHQSMVKTIELILGLPTMSLFDMIANDMRASFHNDADVSSYSAVQPKQSLTERNPPASALKGEQRKAALASAKMNWDLPDAAPTERLNRILWASIKGWGIPYPAVKQAVFSPFSLDIDDDDR